MRRIILALVAVAIVLGMFVIPQAPVAEAGSNGQQLAFFAPAGTPKITWLYVNGYYYNNTIQTWSRSLNPSVTGYDLTNYWWKSWNGRDVDIRWRLENGVYGSCLVRVPVSMPGNWIMINVSRNGGTTCYAS